MARPNRSVEKRNWHPGQQLPGFLNQLALLVILTPHLGQVTVIVLSFIMVSPCIVIKKQGGPVKALLVQWYHNIDHLR
jgi:hypothetical protein